MAILQKSWRSTTPREPTARYEVRMRDSDKRNFPQNRKFIIQNNDTGGLWKTQAKQEQDQIKFLGKVWLSRHQRNEACNSFILSSVQRTSLCDTPQSTGRWRNFLHNASSAGPKSQHRSPTLPWTDHCTWEVCRLPSAWIDNAANQNRYGSPRQFNIPELNKESNLSEPQTYLHWSQTCFLARRSK